jgi:hypothetical protein
MEIGYGRRPEDLVADAGDHGSVRPAQASSYGLISISFSSLTSEAELELSSQNSLGGLGNLVRESGETHMSTD